MREGPLVDRVRKLRDALRKGPSPYGAVLARRPRFALELLRRQRRLLEEAEAELAPVLEDEAATGAAETVAS